MAATGSAMTIAAGTGTIGATIIAGTATTTVVGTAIAAIVATGAATGGMTAATTGGITARRSEEHTSELQSLMRISYAVFCLKKKNSPTLTHVLHSLPRLDWQHNT